MASVETSSKEFRSALLILVPFTILLALQYFYFIDRNSVNILFSDQWDTYQPLFQHASNSDIFFAQVGQLRLGVGGLLSKFIAELSDWNTRYESFSLGIVTLFSSAAAVFLKFRLFRKLTVWDALIPSLFLGLPQAASPIVVAFPSHAIIPLVLLIIYGLCLTIKSYNLRFLLLLVLNFLAVFTGWAVFIGIITPVLLLILIFKAENSRQRSFGAAALFVACGSLAASFYHYQYRPGIDCFEFPHYPIIDYWYFVAKLFSNTFALVCGRKNYLWEIFGSMIVLMMVGAAISSGIRTVKARTFDPRAAAIFVLILFSFLFAVFASAGRVCSGTCTADGGRYQPLLLPAWLGFIYFVDTLQGYRIRILMLATLVLACFILPETRIKYYAQDLDGVTRIKEQWRDCYLRSGDADKCDTVTGMPIYFPNKSKYVQDRIDFIKERKLNFFVGSK